MNSTPTVCATAAPKRNSDAEMGTMKLETTIGEPTRPTLSTIAGNAASDDRDENATACAGAQNEMNSRGDMPPAMMPSGYSIRATAATVRATTSVRYAGTAPTIA